MDGSRLLRCIRGLTPQNVCASNGKSSTINLATCVAQSTRDGRLILRDNTLILDSNNVYYVSRFSGVSSRAETVLRRIVRRRAISVTGTNVVAALGTQASVLTSTGPVRSGCGTSESVIRGLGLPPAVLSQFSVVCLVLSGIDTRSSRHLNQRVISLCADNNTSGASTRIVMPRL